MEKLNKPATSCVPRYEPNLGELMKTKFTALALAAVTALALAPKPAQASDKGLAVVGGLIGGLLIASAINDHNHTTVVYDSCDTGYWNDVSVQVWVPGCWIVERRHHGREYRRYVDGHYESHTNRVWVAYDRHDRRHDRRDARYDNRNDRRDDRRGNRR